ncbi:MAG: hypothetical protein K6F99_02830 [Lachnospiraceae bacterium]|nr:hypothetical protein [Lachnospiraceae bacterium]
MSAFGMGPGLSGTSAAGNAGGAEDSEGVGKVEKNPGESTIKEAGRKSSPAECETCKERKYQDGSDEMVSFKSASHISPEAAPARVRAHEEEHVSNAYKKAAEGNGKVLRASVSIHMSICPECGRSYVSGGETRTSIKYPNEENPYQKNRKALHADAFSGANVDLAV